MSSANPRFLNELLQSIGTRVRRRSLGKDLENAPFSQVEDACERLMDRVGEASRVAVAEQALDAYARLDRDDRIRFFRLLLDDYGVDAVAVRDAYREWEASESESSRNDLFTAVESQRQTLLRRLNLAPGGTLQLVRMRRDLLRAINEHAALAPLDADFSHLLSSWFNRGFLVMRQIDWNTPASILEKIVAYEAVHEITGWDDLRRRLDPADRRCYGFFHPALGDEPLIFVEVALCGGIPETIGPLINAGVDDAETLDTAVFYSISNCQPGLKGVSFGNFLIKQVVRDITLDLPRVKTFVTLSPAPGFARWLASVDDEVAHGLSIELARPDWTTDVDRQAQLSPTVRLWAARYFVEAKQAAGLPVDPVTRFHLGNGASAHRINWPADFAAGALERAHGVMINYLYELDSIEARHEAFVEDGTVTHGPDVKRLLQRRRQSAKAAVLGNNA